MSPANNTGKGKTKKTSRPRPLPPNVTARNLAIEKRRRKSMNEKFLELARCVPALASAKRLSKTRIVDETVHHLRQQRAMCIAAARDMRHLLAAHLELASEVTTLRSQLGIPAGSFQKLPTAAMVSLIDVENEAFGEFPEGLGNQQASTSFNLQLTTSDALVGLSADDMAPVTGQGTRIESFAQDNPSTIFNDIDVAKFFAEWQGQPSVSHFSSFDCPAEPSSTTDYDVFDITHWNSENMREQEQTWEDLQQSAMPDQDLAMMQLPVHQHTSRPDIQVLDV